MNDIDKEKDVDMEEVRRICSGKTVEELEAEFEAFKKNLQKSINKKESKAIPCKVARRSLCGIALRKH